MPSDREAREARIPDDLMDLSHSDPLVYQALRLYIFGAMNYETMLERLAVLQAKQAQRAKQQLIDHALKDTTPIYFRITTPPPKPKQQPRSR